LETVREILAAHSSGISKPGLLAWARLRIDTKMTDAQLDEELAKLGDEVVDVDGFLYLRSVRERASESPWEPDPGAPRWGVAASEDEDGRDESEPTPQAGGGDEGRADGGDHGRVGPTESGAWSPPPAARRGLPGIGKVIGLVFVGFWVFGLLGNLAEGFLAGWTESATPVPTQPSSPEPTPSIGSVIAFDEMVAGDCIVLPTESEFSEVRRVPCDTPHGGEIFLVADHPDGAYPTDDAFGQYVATKCGPAFQSWTGSAYEDQDVLDYSWFTPTEESWTSGYRSFECYLAPADGSLADRSYRGANP
jgi:hypothetical protein